MSLQLRILQDDTLATEPTLAVSGGLSQESDATGGEEPANEIPMVDAAPLAFAPLPSQKLDRGVGLTMRRHHTRAGVHPFDEITWERRTAAITNTRGETIFEQKGVEFPATWSQTATAVVVSKYFRGTLDTPERESSVRQLIGRVVGTIGQWGREGRYFATESDARVFEDELTWLLLNQRMAFNSPVWFNVGFEARPQCSACFINSVEDTMESILSLAKTEGMLFKFGSGTGSNLSPLRSSREQLAGGGEASGPVSFMKGFDAFAGVIKSGGKTRRAAKMVILDVTHPDIADFIRCKASEEKKAWALIEAGYDGRIDGEAYGSVFFQNSNNSVRTTDNFMRAVQDDGEWTTRAVKGGRPMDTWKARELMEEVAKATWACGDPGMQFDTTINSWHTCPESGRINASNPCSEYMFLDDSACNLASLNLMRFVGADGELDIEAFRHAVALTLTAQEILVDFAAYPTERIGKNSVDFRPLGLGYANLGALLMTRGLAYDSPQGRAYAAAITALMHGEANLQSARLAEQIGAFPKFEPNRNAMHNVMLRHRAAVGAIDASAVPAPLMGAVRQVWDQTVQEGTRHGYRNAQVTVLAPTGTIAFMMDCDTTGIEPDIALVKYKKLVGGGTLKIVNQAVPAALRKLGYSPDQIADITLYIDQNDTIEGAPNLRDAHLSVFDCAFKPANGTRSIHYMGHLNMMGAVQPFLSGAISKTVNLPNDATVDDVTRTYMEAWRQGIKAVAIYRDGCKRAQPLTTHKTTDTKHALEAPAAADEAVLAVAPAARRDRRKLPDERQAITHKFSIAGHEGYITAGMYEDGTLGEVFIVMAKEGSTLSGLLDAFATAISMALQYGVPLPVLCDKFTATRFEPSGFTGNRDIPIAKSITDYLFRWLALKFLNRGPAVEAETAPAVEAATGNASEKGTGASADAVRTQAGNGVLFKAHLDSPLCPSCGRMMFPSGACYRCDCGATSGGCS
jgi:ribonucleoside-diphosphate reductase alpha chain